MIDKFLWKFWSHLIAAFHVAVTIVPSIPFGSAMYAMYPFGGYVACHNFSTSYILISANQVLNQQEPIQNPSPPIWICLINPDAFNHSPLLTLSEHFLCTQALLSSCCQLSTQWSVKLTGRVCIWVPWLWCGEVDCRSHQLCIISLFTNATFSVQENQLWINTVLCVNKFVMWIVALSWNNWSCWDLPSTKAKMYLAHWGWDKLAIILV